MTDDLHTPEAELARLADGSLPPAREAELRAEVTRSPELARALSEQERAIALMRSAEVPAPDSLRQRVEEQSRAAAASRRLPRLRLRLAFPAAVTAVALAAAVVIVLTGGSATGAPTLQQTVRLALASATYPAPSEATSTTLRDTAAGIPFPYWGPSVGWRAVGARADRLSGRYVVTVFYSAWKGSRVGYSIVGGAPLRVDGGSTVTRGGVTYTLLREGSARLVTWLRSGHTCVIAGHGVSNQMLMRLATADIPA